MPGKELPLKFSSGTSQTDGGIFAFLVFVFLKKKKEKTREVHFHLLKDKLTAGSIRVISTSREDYIPSSNDSEAESREIIPEISVRVKGWRDDESLDSLHHSQANWILQYMEQQEEVT